MLQALIEFLTCSSAKVAMSVVRRERLASCAVGAGLSRLVMTLVELDTCDKGQRETEQPLFMLL